MMTKATHAQGKVRHPTFGQGVGPCSGGGIKTLTGSTQQDPPFVGFSPGKNSEMLFEI
jgi:hypothetical protein